MNHSRSPRITRIARTNRCRAGAWRVCGGLLMTLMLAGCGENPDWSFEWPGMSSEPEVGRYILLGEIRTNTRTPDLTGRVEAAIEVGLAESASPVDEDVISDNTLVLRNAAILYFADQPPEELRGEAGRTRAAGELRDRFNAALPRPVVAGVRFDSLLVR